MTLPASVHPDFDAEQAFLAHAYACLNDMRDKLASQGDAGGDPKASAALKELRDRMLERMGDPNSVCFGRLDLEDGAKYYVGPQQIRNREDDLIVINWAADAARPFYEATPDVPMELELRRRFRTDREKLLGIADEVFGTSSAVQPTIADILLEELGRERTAEMRDIAATIQADQYRIISRPLESTTVVQGGPGTGKTAVGLHRAAFLLFRHRRELVTSRVLVVGPNSLFMQYIAYVLPSLGESAADQVAVESLPHVPISGADDRLVAQVKGDERMVEVLRRAVVDRIRLPREDLEFQVGGIAFRVPATAISELVADFDASGTSYLAARERFRGAFERLVAASYAAAAAAAVARQPELQIPSAIDPRRSVDGFESTQERIWPSISAAELVRQLLSSEERLNRAGADVLTETERRLLFRKPVATIDEVAWTLADGPLVDEVQHLLDGGIRRYGHVVLDEAQDLTPMQLRMVGRRVREGSVTVLGDLAQATGLWGYSDWDTISRHLGLEPRAEVEELTLAYRVPREIMEVALPVLDLTAPSIRPPEAFRSYGEGPAFIEVSRGTRAARAVDAATRVHGTGGTVAIIAPSTCLRDIRAELVARDVDFGDAEKQELGTAIELVDPVGSKGLEFDHVVLVEPAAVIRDASESRGHQELYVAMTRAMRTLTCLHAEPLPWPLGSAEPRSVPIAAPAPAEEAHLVVAPREDLSPPPTVPGLSVGEALVLARMRGLDLDEALVRALLVRRAGGSEADASAALLDPEGADGAAVAAVMSAAHTWAGNGRNVDA